MEEIEAVDLNEDDLREEITLQREIIQQLFEYLGDKPNPERVIERGRCRGEEKVRAALEEEMKKI